MDGEERRQSLERLEIARLEGRVEALEEALRRRSAELGRFQRLLGADGLAALATSGSADLANLADWRESTDLSEQDVETVLTGLWRALATEH